MSNEWLTAEMILILFKKLENESPIWLKPLLILKDMYSLFNLLNILQFYDLRRYPKFSKNSQKKYGFLLKNSIQPRKIWSFAWKIKNRPTIGDFEKKTEVLNENLKIVLPMGILKKKKWKKIPTPNFTKCLNP